MTLSTWPRLAIAAGILFAPPAMAQAPSARAEFERLGLLGHHSIDCIKPASNSNGYIFYRPLDAKRVQRDTMIGPDKRLFVSVAETATAAGNEIVVSGTADGKPLLYTLRIDGKRHRVTQWTEGGNTSVVDSIWIERKSTMPWLTRCS